METPLVWYAIGWRGTVVEMFRMKKVCVVIPAYNEEKSIGGVLESIPAFVDYVVVVDDASVDGTYEKVKQVVEKNPNFFLMRNKLNQGVGGAIITGNDKGVDLGADILCVISGDGQMDPIELPRLLAPIVDGKADYAKGNRLSSRKSVSGMPRTRLVGNILLSCINKVVSGYWQIRDSQNGYTAITRKCFESLPTSRLRRDYFFENDVLVHLNVLKKNVVDIRMNAVYGSEISGILVISFILKAIPFFIERFFWRVKLWLRGGIDFE